MADNAKDLNPQQVTIPVDGAEMPGLLWLPEAGQGPGLVLFQEIFGMSEYIQQRAADLAELGYVVLAPQFYHRLDNAEIDEQDPEFLSQAMEIVGRFDWPTGVADGVAALAWLRERDEVTGSDHGSDAGVIGFCFGGGLAFNVAAESDPAVLVSYYGSALPSLLDLAPQVSCPSLHHFGTSDSYINTAEVSRIRDAVGGGAEQDEDGARDDVVFLTYEGADHAFDNPHPMFFHEAASAEAWEATTAFLGRYLPVDG